MVKFQIVLSHGYQHEIETKIYMDLMQYILNFPSFPIKTTVKIFTFFEQMSPWAISVSLSEWR